MEKLKDNEKQNNNNLIELNLKKKINNINLLVSIIERFKLNYIRTIF